MITFSKFDFSELPAKVQTSITSFTDKEVLIDDTQLTAPQIAKFTDLMTRLGYKQQ